MVVANHYERIKTAHLVLPTICNSDTQQDGLLNPAKLTIALLLPVLTPHARRTPQDILRIDLPLDFEEALVVVAPECLLPVLLEWETLSRKHCQYTFQFTLSYDDQGGRNSPHSYTNRRQAWPCEGPQTSRPRSSLPPLRQLYRAGATPARTLHIKLASLIAWPDDGRRLCAGVWCTHFQGRTPSATPDGQHCSRHGALLR